MYPGQQYKQQYGSGSQQPTAQPQYYPPQPYPYQPPPAGYPSPGFPTGGYAPPPGPPPSYPNGYATSFPTPQQYPPSQQQYPSPSQQYPPPPSQQQYPPPPSQQQYPPYPNPYYSASYAPPPQPGAAPPTYQNQAPIGYQSPDYSGRKRALLIGINYINTQLELKGCINDVKNIKNFLIQHYGFREADMVILTDDQSDPAKIPIRANILTAMRWLVNDARPNDSFFFHYSGHGGQVKDLDGDEDDGYDETIMPLDFKKAGEIIDDEMHAIMVKPLSRGVRLTAIFDSCHSGTALDLPYIYSTQGIIKEPNILADGGNALKTAGMSYLRGDIEGIKNSLLSFGKKATSGKKISESNKQNKSSEADVVMFSGCKDAQTSADANEDGKNTGAMSYAFIKTLSKNKNVTYQQLLLGIRDVLAAKYTQKPQLSSSHQMDMNQMFVI